MNATQAEREAYVERLFSSIAPKYDLLNSVISLSRHGAWRRLAVRMSGVRPADSALDVCCGTGDFTFELARRVGGSGRVVGVDLSEPMLDLARRKAGRKRLGWVEFVRANARALPFADASFDCVTIGFGLRNLADTPGGLREIARVLKTGGRLVSLEIFGRKQGVLAWPWKLYFGLLPNRAARLFGADGAAYEYLSRSVAAFVSKDELSGMLASNGFSEIRCRELALGAVCVHIGTRSAAGEM